MSTITPVPTLPSNGVTAGAVQVTGTALRVSARSAAGSAQLTLIRMNASGDWFAVTDSSGQALKMNLKPDPTNTGIEDVSFTLPAEGAAEYYHFLLNSGDPASILAEIESLSAPAAAGGTVPQGRAINTTGGIAGGGDMSADRTLSLGGTADMTLSTGALGWAGASGKNLSLVASGAGTIAINNASTWSIGASGSTTGTIGRSGQALNVNSNVTFDGSQASAASANAVADPGNTGAIPVATDGVCNMTSAGAETRTLADPAFIGQRLTLACDTFGGNIVVTAASAIDSATHTYITLTAAGQAASLVAITVGAARKWRLAGNDGATIS